MNTIQNVDCVEGLKQISDNSVDLILTDPPYGISRELNCKNMRLGTTAKLNFNFGEWDALDTAWFDIACKKARGWLISFCAKKDVGYFWKRLEENGFVAIDVLVWQKPDPLPLNGKTKLLNAWEAAIIGKKPNAPYYGHCVHNIFKYQAPKGEDRIHPTQKPLGLIKRLIELTTKEQDFVLDPFVGSGTTAVACKMLNRRFIGFELSEEYCANAQKRIEKVTTPLTSYLTVSSLEKTRSAPSLDKSPEEIET